LAVKLTDEAELPDYKRLFEASPRLLVVLSPDLKVLTASDAYCHATMHRRDQLLGRYLFDVFPDNPSRPGESTVDKFRASFMRVLQFRAPDIIPGARHDIPRPEFEGGGFEERYWSTISTPVLNDKREVQWIIACTEDVTERTRVQAEELERAQYFRNQQEVIEQLQNTSQYLDALIENLPGILFVKSYPDLRYISINRAMEAILGFSRQEILGKTAFDFCPPEEARAITERDRATLADGGTQIVTEEKRTTRTNDVRYLKTTKTPVRDASGQPKYLLGFSQDITDQKIAEQQLRQAVKMDAIGQLTGGIAHDFNNLLGVVIGNLDFLIENGNLDHDSLAAAGEALQGALRGSDLTRRLLVFSRKQALKTTVIDLNQGLPQIAGMLRRLLGGLILVELHQAQGLWGTRADQAQLDEAILNMAINARDAMPKGGTISIETANVHVEDVLAAQNPGLNVGDYVLLTMTDTGSGMTPETMEHCFEPFFTTKSAEKGTGLGLSMVYGFVKQSGGYIKIDSELGVGTTITIYLARAEGKVKTAPVRVKAEESPNADNELILVVEDEPGLRVTTLRSLAELGYRTLEAEDASSAIRVLDDHPEVDLLFTDVMMPGGMSGLELARYVQKSRPRTKVLLTSGYTGRSAEHAHQDESMPDLLSKPFRKADLARFVSRALQGKKTA
jgi:PAS domain S-box-containing protein